MFLKHFNKNDKILFLVVLLAYVIGISYLFYIVYTNNTETPITKNIKYLLLGVFFFIGIYSIVLAFCKDLIHVPEYRKIIVKLFIPSEIFSFCFQLFIEILFSIILPVIGFYYLCVWLSDFHYFADLKNQSIIIYLSLTVGMITSAKIFIHIFYKNMDIFRKKSLTALRYIWKYKIGFKKKHFSSRKKNKIRFKRYINNDYKEVLKRKDKYDKYLSKKKDGTTPLELRRYGSLRYYYSISMTIKISQYGLLNKFIYLIYFFLLIISSTKKLGIDEEITVSLVNKYIPIFFDYNDAILASFVTFFAFDNINFENLKFKYSDFLSSIEKKIIRNSKMHYETKSNSKKYISNEEKKSICGVKTHKGGFCKRKATAGCQCWQHAKKL